MSNTHPIFDDIIRQFISSKPMNTNPSEDPMKTLVSMEAYLFMVMMLPDELAMALRSFPRVVVAQTIRETWDEDVPEFAKKSFAGIVDSILMLNREADMFKTSEQKETTDGEFTKDAVYKELNAAKEQIEKEFPGVQVRIRELTPEEQEEIVKTQDLKGVHIDEILSKGRNTDTPVYKNEFDMKAWLDSFKS